MIIVGIFVIAICAVCGVYFLERIATYLRAIEELTREQVRVTLAKERAEAWEARRGAFPTP